MTKIRGKISVKRCLICALTLCFFIFVEGVHAGDAESEGWLHFRGDDSYPPYEYLDNQGVAQGFNVDLTLAVAKAMGLNIQIDLGPWSEVRSQLENGQIDGLTGMFFSPDRASLVEFSSAFIVVSYAVFVRDDSSITSFDQLADKSILVQQGDICDDYLTKNHIGRQIIRQENPAKALKLLADGHYDCAVIPRLLGFDLINTEDLHGLKAVGEPILPRRYCIAVKKGEERLVSQINEGLSLIHTSGRYDEIYNKWFGQSGLGVSWHKALIYAATVLLPLLLLLATVLVWSWTLRRKVAEQTGHLVAELKQREEAERELANRERYRKALIDSSIDGILTLDQNRIILECNPAFLNLFGYRADEVIGSSSVLIHPSWDHFNRFGREVYPLVKTKGYWRGEWEYKRKDGTIFPMDTSLSPITGPGHQTLGYVAVVRDASERKKAEEEKAVLESQLRQAQKMEAMGTLAGGIAHDFNNILGAVMGFAELALWDAKEGKADPENLSRVLEAAKRAKELVRQILTFSRKVETQLQPVSLEPVTLEAIKLLERTIPKMVNINSKFAANLPDIKADPNMIEQIIMNMASNAADAMPNGGLLTISGSRVELDEARAGALDIPPGNYINLRFADTGAGMDEETVSMIFDPFFTTKEVGKGTGLGLSTVFGAVKSHGGTITCQSSPGEGTVFDIYFPVFDSVTEDKPVEKPHQDVLSGRGEVVLIIDDEKDLRDTAKGILSRYNYKVLTAPDGDAGLEVLRGDYKIDLILMDVGLPGLGGPQLLERIRALQPAVPVLVISGYGREDSLRRTLEQGTQGFVPKPFDAHTLLSQIAQALKSAAR